MQKNGFWNTPKEGVKANTVVEDLFTTLARNMEEELGFKGMKIIDAKPAFKQIAFIYDFAKQEYDKERALSEKNNERPTLGKLYHLAIMEYTGPDEIPVVNNNEIADYKWVTQEEAHKLLKENLILYEKGMITSKYSAEFNIVLFKKISHVYESIKKILTNEVQETLF